ncbi:pseudouridine synthase [Daedalea quercina L-15889]|uniref:Pseudouridine synthase n=1 Tax=Daedalea quercina L-15889 TaxID=1314783 RepID=A0A165P1E8_9APHY|nr:pseudouridine synthase [Daedalea quercina L-15889]
MPVRLLGVRHLLIPRPINEAFGHVVSRILHSTISPSAEGVSNDETTQHNLKPTLRRIPPYWCKHTAMAKRRWVGRDILEVLTTEFRGRSTAYYQYALDSGATTINGKVAKAGTIIKNGDCITSLVHQHEPPVTSTLVRIVHHDRERGLLIVDKPGSIPVHPAGPYCRNSLVEILKSDFGFDKVHAVNRLDRLTSGVMIIALNAQLASHLTKMFVNVAIQKEYIARCKGRFPKRWVTCDQPLLTIDRQVNLNIVHPKGKSAKTNLKALHYDTNTDTSVILCRPLTGRPHQIRVHLQYLGYPIVNDPIYSDPKIWGKQLGKGGLDLTPSDARTAPAPPRELGLSVADNPEGLSRKSAGIAWPDGSHSIKSHNRSNVTSTAAPKPLPRETGHDVGMSSPIPLSAEMVGIIMRLRNAKDEDGGWSRWRDVAFLSKGTLSLYGTNEPQSPQEPSDIPLPPPVMLTDSPACVSAALLEPASVSTTDVTPGEGDAASHCPECYLPLQPDPKPEQLYICLHALRYETPYGSFETEMPEWAAEGGT